MTVEDGVEFILSHLNDPDSPYPIFPRRISTHLSENCQFMVNNKEEALKKFQESAYFDCRISAYPLVDNHPPNFIFIDLDRKEFKTKSQLNKRLDIIIKKINDFGADPTVIWSGNGYHIYLPIDCNINNILNGDIGFGLLDVLLEVSNKIDLSDLSKLFFKFMESFLSDGYNDKNHNVSIKACLIRIPETLNSKNNAKIYICRKWNNKRIGIDKFIPYFLKFINEYNEIKIEEEKKYESINYDNISNIFWIEKLLETPIMDHRRYAMWKIISPYLINIKKLNYNEAFAVIYKWLELCHKVNYIKWNKDEIIKISLKNTKKYKPLSLKKLAIDNKELFNYITAK